MLTMLSSSQRRRQTRGWFLYRFKPKSISISQLISHLKYVWNGEKIIDALSIESILNLGT